MAVAGGAAMQGTIKKLFSDKGYGFVRGADGVERFFHRGDCLTAFGTLREGDPVSFEEGQHTDKGPRAAAVQSDRETGFA